MDMASLRTAIAQAEQGHKEATLRWESVMIEAVKTEAECTRTESRVKFLLQAMNSKEMQAGGFDSPGASSGSKGEGQKATKASDAPRIMVAANLTPSAGAAHFLVPDEKKQNRRKEKKDKRVAAHY